MPFWAERSIGGRCPASCGSARFSCRREAILGELGLSTTSNPPQPPNEPARHTASQVPDPYGAYSAGWPGGPPPPPVGPAKGMSFAVAAVVLGLVGCVLPLAPFNFDGIRMYLPWVFGLPGLTVGIIGCIGRRRGKALAITGTVLSGLALVVGAIMLISYVQNSSASNSSGDDTQEILRDELDVRLGDWHADAETGSMSVTVTLYNKGSDTATFGVTLRQEGDGETCEARVSVDDLSPGASYQEEAGSCSSATSLENLSFQVTKVTKD